MVELLKNKKISKTPHFFNLVNRLELGVCYDNSNDFIDKCDSI